MATMKLQITSAAILLLLSISFSNAVVFDVTKFGGKAGDMSSFTKALASAWKKACASKKPSKVLIPRGKYELGEIKLQGPCEAPIQFELRGTVKAPADSSRFVEESWVTFNYLNHFTLFGGGVFDGQGKLAWSENDCHKNSNCKSVINLRFNFVTNSLVRDITTLDSKNFHVNVIGCKNFTFDHFTVSAPAESVNTDGIHIAKVDGIYVTNSKIGTGDDCISIGDGSYNIHVTGVKCGPGHGISVGSLGRTKGEEPVKGLWVKNCTISNTDNGIRVKTWPASFPGSVSDLHFEDITMDNVRNPIIIDQLYCPYNQCNAEKPSLVKISKVSFKNIHGTSLTPVAVKLSCSSKVPCKDVVINNVKLTYTGLEAPSATSECSAVVPSLLGEVRPPVCGITT